MNLFGKIIFAGIVIGEVPILYGFSITPAVITMPGCILVMTGVVIVLDTLLLAALSELR